MPTLSDLTAYLRHLADDRRLAPSTIAGYREELSLLVGRHIPLEAESLARFVTHDQKDRLLASTTRNRRLAVVRGFTRYLVSTGRLPSDPSVGIQRARVAQSVRAALSTEEIGRVAAATARDPDATLRARDGAIVALLFYTGLRVSELARLDAHQVDLVVATVRGAVRKGGGTTDLLLHPQALRALHAWLAVRQVEPDNPALFPRGLTRLSVRAIQKRVRQLGERAGLTIRLHPHALRHAHATALLRVGVSTELIRQSLNHASLSTTARYLHSDTGLLRGAICSLPDIPFQHSPSPSE